MADMYGALLGLGGTDDQYAQQLANSLRRQGDWGGAIGMSTIPQAQEMGQRMQRQSVNAASTIGSRRQQLIRDIEQEKRKRQSLAEQWGDPTGYQGPEGTQFYQTNKLGEMRPVEELAGMSVLPRSTGRGAGGGKTKYKAKVGGVEGIYDTTENTFTPFATGVPQDVLQEQVDFEAGVKGDTAKQKALGKGEGESVDESIDAAYGAAQGKRATIPALNDIIASIDEGARTGKVWNRLPTFTDATSRYESAIAKLTLDNLTNYKLTPVSDKDIAVLREAAFGDYTGDTAKEYAQHKIESLELLAQADEAVGDYLNEVRRRPNASDRKKMDAIVKGIIGDFDFTFHGDKAKESGGEEAGTTGQPMIYETYEEWVKAGMPDE